MPEVTVRRRGIAAEDAAAAVRSRLGDGVAVSAVGSRELQVRKSYFTQASVTMTEQPGGTVFRVKGSAPASLPLWMLVMRLVNERGIARQVASAIGEYAGFSDDD